ncbi:MAG: hypothetical protein IJ086_07065 [Clostridium sp.]|nr:hypothetical protein [Clostridium sp.]
MSDKKDRSVISLLFDTLATSIFISITLNISCHILKYISSIIQKQNTEDQAIYNLLMQEEEERNIGRKLKAKKEFKDWLKERGEYI